LAQGVLRLMGAVDVLIHAAGVHGVGTVHATPSAELDRHYHINLRAPYLLTRGLLGSLRSRRGQVVFVNSSAGVVARAGVGPYSASKHALRAIADSLREEVNPDGVRVLSVFLGRTATPMQEALHRAEGRAYRPERLLQPEDVAEVVEHLLALPRTAEVTDLHMRPLARWDVS
jgi:NAD(P)-dependent dehydrogenase (short-subunit alcohol dehydrogenase family)